MDDRYKPGLEGSSGGVAPGRPARPASSVRRVGDGSASPDYPFLETVLVDFMLNESCGEGRVIGLLDRYEVTGPGQRNYLMQVQRCVDVPTWDEAAAAVTPVPPLSPASARAVILEHLPVPRVAVSPAIEGLTGLETWLWYDHDGAPLSLVDHDRDPATQPAQGMTVSAREGPYAIEATVWIERYSWDTGEATVTSREPGSEARPAATHTYRTKSPDYTIVASARWTGTYAWSSPSGGASGQPLGDLEVDSPPRPYPVVEIVSVPAPPLAS